MGRPRKPTAVLLANGAFEQNPQRAVGRGVEPQPTGELAPPPAYLSPHELECWQKIVAECTAGVLKKPHWTAVLAATRLRAKLELGDILAPEHSQLRGWLRELAMTPASTTNVHVPPEKAANEFSNI
jgi:hypothetical protein